MFGPHHLHGQLERGMLRHFLQGALGYVGLAVLEPFVAYHVPYLDISARADLLERLADYVDRLDDMPVMAMPDLAQFGPDFSPLAR